MLWLDALVVTSLTFALRTNRPSSRNFNKVSKFQIGCSAFFLYFMQDSAEKLPLHWYYTCRYRAMSFSLWLIPAQQRHIPISHTFVTLLLITGMHPPLIKQGLTLFSSASILLSSLALLRWMVMERRLSTFSLAALVSSATSRVIFCWSSISAFWAWVVASWGHKDQSGHDAVTEMVMPLFVRWEVIISTWHIYSFSWFTSVNLYHYRLAVHVL